MVRNVRRVGDVRLVTGDEHVVLGRDQVGLDVVGTHPRRELVGGQRVLGPIPGRAAVADDQHLVRRRIVSAWLVLVRERRAGDGAGDEQEREGAGTEQPSAKTGTGHARSQYAYAPTGVNDQ
jgi:hypothetical protein